MNAKVPLQFQFLDNGIFKIANFLPLSQQAAQNSDFVPELPITPGIA